MSNYPTSLDSFTNPIATNKLNSPPHSQQHGDANDAITALETKLGISASTPSANKVLRATGTGTSAWGAIVNADVSASAAIVYSKLSLTTSIVPGDFAATAWTTWTPSVTGVTGLAIGFAQYMQYGKNVSVEFSVSGVSNSISKTITLPVAIKNGGTVFPMKGTDAGTPITQMLYGDITSATSILTVYASLAGGNWTNGAGVWALQGKFTYQAN